MACSRSTPCVTLPASSRGAVLISTAKNRRNRGAGSAPPRPCGPDGVAADARTVSPTYYYSIVRLLVIRLLNRYYRRRCRLEMEIAMETVTVSPKYQVVIPKSVRDKLRILPGQKVQAIAYQGRIEFILVLSAKELRGFVKGIDTSVPREGDRV